MSPAMDTRMVEVRKRRSEVAKRDIKIRIDRDLAALLDEWARQKSVSRGAIIERALDFYFGFREVSKENTTHG
jgi:predicted transcriptional regulator